MGQQETVAEPGTAAVDASHEIAIFRRAIARHGQPVLAAGCSLPPLQVAGADIDRCDVVAELLGLTRKYRTIVMGESFGNAVHRERDLDALTRCHALLEPRGALVLGVEVDYRPEDPSVIGTRCEVLLMLTIAGFRDITVLGDFTGEAATARHGHLVFTALGEATKV